MANVPSILRNSANLHDQDSGKWVGFLNPVTQREERLWDVIEVPVSRELTSLDDGQILELAADVALTVPLGLPVKFGCLIIPAGTNTIVSAGGTLLNGATDTLSRPANLTSNTLFALQGRASVADSYVVTGAAA